MASFSDTAAPLWNLQGVRAVVTGSSKGIGLEIAKEFVRLGAQVVIVSRKANDVARVVDELSAKTSGVASGGDSTDTPSGAAGGGNAPLVYGCAADVSTEEGRSTLVEFVLSTWGGALDVLVNNVGVNMRVRVEDTTEAQYRTMMSTNVDSAYFLCKGFYPALKLGTRPSVVNVASVAGVTSTGTGSVYAMSKAAIVHLTKSLACEWGPDGVRVNCVAPWMTMTPMLADAVKGDTSSLDKAKAATPLAVGLNRLPEPRESAYAVAFLSMPAASFISGQTISVDGGFTTNGFLGPCVAP